MGLLPNNVSRLEWSNIRATADFIIGSVENESESYEPSDYVGTLLRDPTSSRLLETLVRRLPKEVFDVVWSTYLAGKLARLAVHPVANFIVARAVMRLSAAQLSKALNGMDGIWTKLISEWYFALFLRSSL